MIRNMAEKLSSSVALADSDKTCGICLEDSKKPVTLPCGHSFCEGCLDGWRPRCGVKEEVGRKCPNCRARIPPSKEMVATLQGHRDAKQRFEYNNYTSSVDYQMACKAIESYEEIIGKDWDGVTVLEDNNDKQPVMLPDYIVKAFFEKDINKALRWINANRREDRVNAKANAENMGMSALMVAAESNQLELVALLLQMGANINVKDTQGMTAIFFTLAHPRLSTKYVDKVVRLLLSWGSNFYSERLSSRELCICVAKQKGAHELEKLLESELGGRRCEIISLTSRPELNGKTCVADEYLPGSNEYKVTLETIGKDVLVLSPNNLKRRDRTPQDCGYYIEFRNGRTIQHDFDSSEDCQAFVAALSRDETQPAVTEEAEARAEQAAAELLAELGLDNIPKESSSGGQVKRSKKWKGGKKKRKK